MRLTTTLARIKAHNPCEDGLEQLLKHLGSGYPEDKEVDLLTILESNGVAHFIWAIRAVEDIWIAKRITRDLAIKFAERVLPIFEKEYPKNNKPRKAIEVAKSFLKDNKGADNFCVWEVLAKVKVENRASLSAKKSARSSIWAVKSVGQSGVNTVVESAGFAAVLAVESRESDSQRLEEKQAQIDIIKEVLA